MVSQILAWNGGGISNHSQIVAQGGYEAKSDSSTRLTDALPSVDELKKDIRHMMPTKETFSKGSLKQLIHEVVDEVVHEMDSLRSTVA